MRQKLQVFLVGIALFSMFFGGGNLTFPLWVGIETTSPALSSIGFILTGVLLPFFGVMIGILFKGDYHACLSSVWGKRMGALLVFALLLFWIPLGSGPRCNQLAWGAFCQMQWGSVPLWVYSALYSVLVYFLTVRKNRILEILGKVITPMLIFALLFLFFSIFSQPLPVGEASDLSGWNEFISAVSAGFYTMDFIAAIFFATTIITLVKERQKDAFQFSFVRNVGIVAISLLSIVYVGMISVGYVNADVLSLVSRDQLLAAVAQVMFDPKFKVLIFMIISLSVLSTSIALAFVFSEYLRERVFKEKLSHKSTLALALISSFVLSLVGFDRLAVLISYTMSVLYFVLLFTTVLAVIKYFRQKSSPIVSGAAKPELEG